MSRRAKQWEDAEGACRSALDAYGTVGRARDTERRYRLSSETFTLLGAGSGGHSGAALQIRTEESYLFWVRRFILFHGKRHPRELGAVDRRVSASTQNQALNALVFLYKAALERPLGDVGSVVQVQRPQPLPVILHVTEVKALFRYLEGSHWLAAFLMYGLGLRLMEALRLPVKDLDFEHPAILVCDGKGQKDRIVTLADELIRSLATPSGGCATDPHVRTSPTASARYM